MKVVQRMRTLFRGDDRDQLAKSIESLLEEATAPVPQSMRRFLPIYRRHVVVECAVPLGQIAAALRDHERPVSNHAVREIGTFLTQTDRSTLYGESAQEARRDADLLAMTIAADTRLVIAA